MKKTLFTIPGFMEKSTNSRYIKLIKVFKEKGLLNKRSGK